MAGEILGRSPVILPIPGTARIHHLEENFTAERLRLTLAHRNRLGCSPPAVPV